MPDSSTTVADEIRHSLKWLTRATVALYIILIAVTLYFIWDARRTKDAVCAFRADLVERVDASEAYLADHPEGVFGLSAAQIRSSLDGQRRTISALSSAGC